MPYVFDEDLARHFATVSTGSSATGVPRKIQLNFDQYEIVIAVTEDNKVIGVLEVRQKKDFRNVQQKIASTGSVGMERFVTE